MIIINKLTWDSNELEYLLFELQMQNLTYTSSKCNLFFDELMKLNFKVEDMLKTNIYL